MLGELGPLISGQKLAGRADPRSWNRRNLVPSCCGEVDWGPTKRTACFETIWLPGRAASDVYLRREPGEVVALKLAQRLSMSVLTVAEGTAESTSIDPSLNNHIGTRISMHLM